MPIILLEKDPFIENEPSALAASRKNKEINVRRPISGMSTKEDVYAYLSVYQDAGKGQTGLIPVSLKDSSAPNGHSQASHNFILQSVQLQRQERVQIIETFGDTFSFFFGEKALVLVVSGMLLNSADFNWANEWQYNYERFLRGTKCVENRCRVFLSYEDWLAQGYILNCSTTVENQMPFLVPFQFSMLLTQPPTDLTLGATLVEDAGDARIYVSNGLQLAEYLKPAEAQDLYEIDPITGISTRREGRLSDLTAESAYLRALLEMDAGLKGLEDPKKTIATPSKVSKKTHKAAQKVFDPGTGAGGHPLAEMTITRE